MWNGIWTEELDNLYDAYMEKFDGALPDGYIELNYDHIPYDEFIQYMKICIETGLEMPDIVP